MTTEPQNITPLVDPREKNGPQNMLAPGGPWKEKYKRVEGLLANENTTLLDHMRDRMNEEQYSLLEHKIAALDPVSARSEILFVQQLLPNITGYTPAYSSPVPPKSNRSDNATPPEDILAQHIFSSLQK